MSKRDAAEQLAGTFSSIDSIDGLEAKWRVLESEATCSFFLTWSWIGPWIRLAANHVDVQLYECRQDEQIIGLGIASRDIVCRRQLFRSTTLFLNEAARPDLNVFIEYNGLLTRTGYEARVLQQFIQDAARTKPQWDEIQLTNIPQTHWSALTLRGARLVSDIEHTTWIASLEQVADLDGLLSRMSSNRRSKIRRTFKEYEKEGQLMIDSAATTAEAIEYFRALGVLHTERWNRVGVAGSFAKPKWIAFHEDLIRTAFPRREIQLLRVRCGPRPIGYLYNFLWRGDVLMLQSGFASESSNLLRPGYVSHILAMQLNARNGANRYDFLVGDAEYKSVLADSYPPLISGRIQRRRAKFIAEDALTAVYRKARRLLSRSGGSNRSAHSQT